MPTSDRPFAKFIRTFRAAFLAAAGLAAALPVAALADEHAGVFGERETRAIESIITDYLVDNPEVIIRALEVLQERERIADAERARAALEESRASLERDPNSPVAGNPDGDVTVVEFFDYRCPYCKRVTPTVTELLESDKNVRLVYKEWPILGEDSEFAARAALAAREQGKYLEFHEKVMDQRQVTEQSVLAASKELGLDVEKLREDMKSPKVDAHLEETMRLAEVLGINGTPAFVIGNQLIPGVASLEQMQAIVEEERSKAASE